MQKQRFHGNGKNYHLTVLKTGKYRRLKQVINCVDHKTKELTGEVRIIEHYLTKP